MAAVALLLSAMVRWRPRLLPKRRRTAAALAAPATPKTEDRAIFAAQLLHWGSVAFAVIAFAAMFRPFLALSDSEFVSIVLNTGFSASAGLLFSALFIKRRSAKITAPVARVPLGRKAILTTAPVTVAFLALLLVTGFGTSDGRYALPLLVMTSVLVGCGFLALMRLSSSLLLPDPRLSALDSAWRRVSIKIT